MRNFKTILAAAAITAAMAAGTGAQAAPHHDRHGPAPRHDVYRHHPVHRHHVARARVYDTLRFHHYRGLGAPYFLRGHYVVRSYNRFGRVVFVEVDPYTGAFIGELRL